LFQLLFVLQLEEALARILAAVPGPIPERVPIENAHGRFARERIASAIDLPAFTNSSMDGYAVHAADTKAARSQSPVSLRLVGRVAAGSISHQELLTGQCVRVFTGSPLPPGADAVVMQEDTRPSDQPEQIAILDGVQTGENVRCQGEDVQRGAVLVEAGGELTSGRVALLSATGLDHVLAGRQPVVGILASGSELREPGQSLAPGQIYESNRAALSALVHRAGAEPKIFPIVRDVLKETQDAISSALESCDILVTSGGVSVGEMDFIKTAFEQHGGTLGFWKVAIKPGRPFVFGQWKQKLLFGLPGNPVSAMVTFLLLVRPALLRWQGAADLEVASCPGVLAEDLVNDGERRHFMRVRLDSEGKVYSAGLQASHALRSLAAANGLVDLTPATTLRAGASVRVIRWD
jgi:molybdopterin molybdotransferase